MGGIILTAVLLVLVLVMAAGYGSRAAARGRVEAVGGQVAGR